MALVYNRRPTNNTGVVYIPPSLRDCVAVEKDANWYVYRNKNTGSSVNISQNPKNLNQYYHHIATRRSLESRLISSTEIVSYVLHELGLELGIAEAGSERKDQK